MALYAKDRAQLSNGADELTKLITGEWSKQRAQNSEQEHALAKLIGGAELEQEAVAANEGRALDLAKTQGLKPGKYSVSASQGGYAVNPEPAKDPLELLLRKSQFDLMRDDRDEKKVQELSKRVENAQIGPSQAALQNLGASVKEKGVAIGPISAALPSWAVSAGEQLGLADKGATEQKQAVAALQAFQRNPLFGASLTSNEQRNFNDAFGLLAGGSPEQRQQAMTTLQSLYNKSVANVAAGSPQRIKERYRAQGGIDLSPSDVFGQQSGGSRGVSKKQYSPSRNQTRIIYSDGSVEIKDGRQ